MTLEEKIGQLIMWDARPDDLSFIKTRFPGSILHIFGEKARQAMHMAAEGHSIAAIDAAGDPVVVPLLPSRPRRFPGMLAHRHARPLLQVDLLRARQVLTIPRRARFRHAYVSVCVVLLMFSTNHFSVPFS